MKHLLMTFYCHMLCLALCRRNHLITWRNQNLTLCYLSALITNCMTNTIQQIFHRLRYLTIKIKQLPICFDEFHEKYYGLITNFVSFAEKYPQIKELFGCDKNMKWKVLLLVSIQFVMIPAVSTMPWTYIFLLAYCFGGVINHALTLGTSMQLLYRNSTTQLNEIT